MLEILQFYVSGFWTWAGITFGLAIVVSTIAELISELLRRRK